MQAAYCKFPSLINLKSNRNRPVSCYSFDIVGFDTRMLFSVTSEEIGIRVYTVLCREEKKKLGLDVFAL